MYAGSVVFASDAATAPASIRIARSQVAATAGQLTYSLSGSQWLPATHSIARPASIAGSEAPSGGRPPTPHITQRAHSVVDFAVFSVPYS